MVDLKPDHVGGLAFEIRIIGGHVTLELGCRSALRGSLRKLFASRSAFVRAPGHGIVTIVSVNPCTQC
jgi:hypothetical protein